MAWRCSTTPAAWSSSAPTKARSPRATGLRPARRRSTSARRRNRARRRDCRCSATSSGSVDRGGWRASAPAMPKIRPTAEQLRCSHAAARRPTCRCRWVSRTSCSRGWWMSNNQTIPSDHRVDVGDADHREHRAERRVHGAGRGHGDPARHRGRRHHGARSRCPRTSPWRAPRRNTPATRSSANRRTRTQRRLHRALSAVHGVVQPESRHAQLGELRPRRDALRRRGPLRLLHDGSGAAGDRFRSSPPPTTPAPAPSTATASIAATWRARSTAPRAASTTPSPIYSTTSFRRPRT